MSQDSPASPASNRDSRETLRAVLVAIALIAFPLLYVFSLGPAVWLVHKGLLSDATTRTAYAPVVWLHDHTAARAPLEWYVELWER